ncbi:VOC family protein [Sphingopyxis sp. GC21]|uniref:VOC family protein n=1 Tax=Sphingopyxis sp. GC21 TaxID=2933562 RepID=UPI0021E437D9|nr:VOC family protein [Sphingopyxis sp. GC21]
MTRLAHVCIESVDLDATEQFYARLGLSRQFDFRNLQGEPIGYYLRFDDVSFLEVVRVSDVKAEGRVMHFAIETDDIDGLRERLVAGGHAPSEKTLGADQTWVVTCRDPSGILIELQEYGENSMQFRGGTCLIDYTP